MKAAENGSTNNVSVLQQAGADFNLTDKEGKTALNYAIEGDHKAVIRSLRSYGASGRPGKEGSRAAVT